MCRKVTWAQVLNVGVRCRSAGYTRVSVAGREGRRERQQRRDRKRERKKESEGWIRIWVRVPTGL